MRIGAVILAGGQSRRMGTDKAGLPFQGKTFLEHIATELSGFEERLISVGKGCHSPLAGWAAVEDEQAGCGPIGGIFSALNACRSDALLVVGCDMPLFRKALADGLISQYDGQCAALIAATRDGRWHPTCGIYGKTTLEVLRRHLEENNYRMMDMLRALKTRAFSLADNGLPDTIVSNINNAQELEALIQDVGALY